MDDDRLTYLRAQDRVKSLRARLAESGGIPAARIARELRSAEKALVKLERQRVA